MKTLREHTEEIFLKFESKDNFISSFKTVYKLNYFDCCNSNPWIISDLCFRCEDYAISLLEQCEDLREVETFLQTRNIGTKDANYILAILDAREKFVAHERFQYVLLKKFGKKT